MAQLCAVTGNIADLGLEPVPNSTAILRPVREGTSVVVGGDVVTLARKPVDISDDGAVAFDAVTAAYFLDVATPTSFTSIRLGVPDAASAVLAAIANTTPPPPLDAAQIALQGAQEARDEAVEAAGEVAEAFDGLDDAITAIGGIENLSSAVTSAANSATVAEQARLAAQTAAGEAQVAKITWRGDWATATAYAISDAVYQNGSSYIAKSSHTSGATSEPENGVDWESFWSVLVSRGASGAGSGDVIGPASSTNNHIAVFDGFTGKAIKGGGVAIADLATAAQGAKADTALQPGAAIPWADVTGKPTFFDGTWASLSGKPATFPPAAHTHPATDVTGLATVATSGDYDDLTGKPTLFSGAYDDLSDKPTLFSGAYGDLTGIPASFTPSAHTHPASAISDSTAAGRAMVTAADAAAQRALLSVETSTQLNARDAANRARAGHTGTQAISTISGLQSALDGKQPLATVLTNTTAAFTTAQETKLAGIATGATANATDAALRDRSTHTGTQPASTVSGLADVATSGAYADLTGAPSLGTAAALNVGTTAGTVAAGNDSRLSDAREWTAATIAQIEAETGTATTRRAWTAQRVRQAILGWWTASADKTKLDGIATGATANASNADLRDRTTHTGEQAISTITGLQTALDGKAGTALFSDVADGLVPSPGAATDTYLRADGVWATPGGSGGSGEVAWADVTGKPTFATVATSGAYADLTGLPTLFSGSWDDLTDKPTLFSGSYTDLTDKPTLFSGAYGDLTGVPATFAPSAHTHPATAISDSTTAGRAMITALDAAAQRTLLSVETTTQLNARDTANRARSAHTGTQPASTITGLAVVATSGAYADLFGKPTLFSGAYADLTGKPLTFPPSAHSHAIADVTGLQAALDGKQAAGSYATAAQGALADSALQPGAEIPWDDITEKPAFATVATSGAYADLSGLPTLFSGAYADLTGIPATFAPAAHNQAWSTITATPTTLAGFGITDAAPLSHVGTGGTAHPAASTTVAGFMSAADKVKLNGISAGATANTGTVTSVSGTGTASGLTLSGTVTGAGSLTLSGTVTPAWADVTGKPNLFSWVQLTQAEYDALNPPNAQTLYVIVN